MHLDLDGTRYPIEVDINGEGRCVYRWEAKLPACPSCGDTLVADDPAWLRHISIIHHTRLQTTHVLCESCGWESEAL